jgi:hypothetical protein
VLWQVDDQPAVPMGHSGEVRTERVTIGEASPSPSPSPSPQRQRR